MRYLIFLSFLLFFAACQQDSGKQLVVIPEQLALRDTAGQKSKEILTLQKGETIQDLGAVSTFESVIELQGKILQSPWIKVSVQQQQGWILAALALPREEKYAVWFENKRLECYFGADLTQRRNTWSSGMHDLRSDARVATQFREAIALRDTFMALLARRAEPSETTTSLNYNWLQQLLPGFIAQKVPLRNSPYLFIDYGYWLHIAAQSAGNQDDLFFEMCTHIFPHDSIESFFPVWKFQLDAAESASQLGSGAHAKILAEMNQKLSNADLFRLEITRLKERIFEDIAGKNVAYWQPAEKILTELNKIQEANLSCLAANDKMVLQARLRMFENPEENGIRVNMRSGE